MKEPILLSPAFKDYLWGGTRLKEEFGKKSDLDKVAESWELSTHKDGQSIVASGEFSGLTLGEYLEKNPSALGENCKKFEFFPILIKFIDAKDNLSIQVHPDDEYSLAHNGEYGKTEMWYILDCEEGASLYYGFKKEMSKEEFKKSIEEKTLLDYLNKVEVKKGDVYFIEAGTVHAIGKGIVICEIQQNSNTTYRVYDYDRRDAQGNARELHVDKAVEVSVTKPPREYKTENDTLLASCKYFTVEKAEVDGNAEFVVNVGSFKSVIVTEGEGILSLGEHKIAIKKGDSAFIPAQDGAFSIKGKCDVIISYV